MSGRYPRADREWRAVRHRGLQLALDTGQQRLSRNYVDGRAGRRASAAVFRRRNEHHVHGDRLARQQELVHIQRHCSR